jgi:hypothetical protein
VVLLAEFADALGCLFGGVGADAGAEAAALFPFAWICGHACLEYLKEIHFLHHLVTLLWIRLSDCLSSHSLSVLADPRHSRLVRGGFGYSFLHKIPPDSPTPCFVFFSC